MADTPKAFTIDSAEDVSVHLDDSSDDATFVLTVRHRGDELERHDGVTSESIVAIDSQHFSARHVTAPGADDPVPTDATRPAPPPPAAQQAEAAQPFAAPPPAASAARSATAIEPKPPRPQVKVGAILVLVGAIVTAVAVYLPWLDSSGEARDGTDLYLTSAGDLLDGPGNIMLPIAVVLAGLGLALLLAGRVLAVAIIAVVMSVIGTVFGLGMIGIVNDDIGGGDLGIGVILQPIAPLVALAGSIVATAKRRR